MGCRITKQPRCAGFSVLSGMSFYLHIPCQAQRTERQRHEGTTNQNESHVFIAPLIDSMVKKFRHAYDNKFDKSDANN
jgi:hypothetical protein